MGLDIFIEAELYGAGNGWTVLEDVVLEVPVEWHYGIDGAGISDRVAQSGAATFALDNSTDNEGHLLGWYSPGHANCRPGWKLGVGLRIRVRYADLGDYYKFAGVVDDVTPIPGILRERRVFVTCVDFMDDVARASIAGLPVQQNQRSDQIFTTLVANMPKQPPAIERGYGMEQYAYALDGARDEGVSVMTEFQKLAQSELGYIYVKGDPLTGGVLTFEDRRKRGTAIASVGVFDRFNVFAAGRKRDQVVNRVLVKVHPRRVDEPLDPFSPLDIDALTCWLDASQLTGLVDGAEIVTWTDESGNGNHFTNGDGSNRRPIYRTGIANGNAVARFDGTADTLGGPTFANLIAAAAGTVFAVFKTSKITGTQSVLGGSTATSRMNVAVLSGPVRLQAMNHSGGTQTTNITTESNQWLIATWLHEGGDIKVGDRDTRDDTLDLTAVSSGDTDGLTTFPRVGAEHAIDNYFEGDIAEVLFFNEALTEADRMNVESYLANKYMVTIPYLPTGLGGISNRIFRLDEKPFIARGTTYKLKAIYKDEAQAAQRIGAVTQQEPAAGTDYTFNSLDTGLGTDLSDQLSFDIAFGGNAADVLITNNGPGDGYLTAFQLRGLGVYDEGEVILEAKDDALIEEYGEVVLPYDMPYQSDPAIALDAASYLLSLNRSEFTVPDHVGFIADQADDLMRHAILREISDRITVTDPMTAVDSDFYINSIGCSLSSEGIFSVVWGISTAANDVFWILDSPTQSQLGETTKLAYGLWNRYWIMGVAAMGTDTRLSS